MRAAMVVSSASLAGSRGAGIEVESLSSARARRVSSDISWPSNFLASSTQALSWARARSLALAATRWLSSLISVEDRHWAAVISGIAALSSALTLAMNWSAVSPSLVLLAAEPLPPLAGEAWRSQADRVSRPAPMASDSSRWRWFMDSPMGADALPAG